LILRYMKILIDEQLPTKLKFRFTDAEYEVTTVRDMDWLGKKNGELLKLMRSNQFDILLTNDKNLHYQQNIQSLGISILNINAKTNRYPDVISLVPLIKNKLKEIEQQVSNSIHGYFTIE
jgi:predicted nuclease of predicted toxin-antitoxin system